MASAIVNYWWEPDSSDMRGEIARNLRLREIRQKLKEKAKNQIASIV